MKDFTIKTLYPYLIAIAIFLLISLIYFSPVLEGKKLQQGDIRNWQGGAKEIVDYREQTGEEALWTNSMFGGMPAYQISVKHESNLIKKIDKYLFRLNLPRPADYVFLYFIGFFIMLLCFRVNPWLSIVGAIAFAFSSYFFVILEAGHNSKAHAIGYFAPVIGSIYLTFKGKRLFGAILTAFFLSLELSTNHLQITYYLALTVAIFGISEFFFHYNEKKIKDFFFSVGLLIIAAFVSIAPNASNILTTMEYSDYSTRGKSELTNQIENKTNGLDRDYVTQWSYGKAETATLLIPGFAGNSSHSKLSKNSETYKTLKKNGIPNPDKAIKAMPLYWGDQPFTSGPVYVGAIAFFFFILGLFLLENRYKWWLLSATILSILLAWGHNFMWFTNLFLDYIPGYDKFRTVTMILVIAEFTIPLMAVLVLKQIFDNKIEKKILIKKLLLSLYITGGLLLFFILFAGGLFNFTGNSDSQYPQWLTSALMSDRESVLRSDSIRSLVFILLSVVVIYLFSIKKIKQIPAIAILGVLILIDMVPVDWRYMDHKNFTSERKVKESWQPTMADKQILQDKDPNFRVLNLAVNTFNDASTSYFHKSIGGYSGVKMKRYQELIEHHIAKRNPSVLNMLNTKYIIVPDKKTNQPIPQRNGGALGNAWFVNEVKIVENSDEEIAALSDFDPSKTAIVDKRFSDKLDNFSNGDITESEIKLIEYKPNYLKYEYTANSEQFAVFSEIYYDKGWLVKIDGEEKDHVRTNYVLRGMIVPAGTHTIEFSFEPKSFQVGSTISLASSILLILLVLAGIFLSMKNSKTGQ